MTVDFVHKLTAEGFEPQEGELACPAVLSKMQWHQRTKSYVLISLELLVCLAADHDHFPAFCIPRLGELLVTSVHRSVVDGIK